MSWFAKETNDIHQHLEKKVEVEGKAAKVVIGYLCPSFLFPLSSFLFPLSSITP
ncbi:hypothetical protein [Endozoicomonas sp. SCSIO W0465]|uniref:hypothetical protein n=1 Tax=Endozoicomonas sp. SCSIO W0465 TaxID=2918516 RepID=UPI002076412B|nr:hypothetical protein [Endozoicomonas sp. SCSIO W0465]USE34625.1 hypothetical protein MJO57_21145 [Endozoicomonas sp. SCSIO W0465]